MMRIDYFYNEKMPKRTAHDGYIWRNCFYLSEQGEEVTLITGPGERCLQQLHLHYLHTPTSPCKIEPAPNTPSLDISSWAERRFGAKVESLQTSEESTGLFHWLRLPLIRKSRFFKLSWNLPFFWRCQKWLEHHRPDWAFFSVYKQAKFHLDQKIPGVRYLFEVQDLAWYPPSLQARYRLEEVPADLQEKVRFQRDVLQACDRVSVTTAALKTILSHPPYEITTPISIIPLASEHAPVVLQANPKLPIRLGYVGQLYPEQGVDTLIKAIKYVPDICLEVIGGHERDLNRLRRLIKEFRLERRVTLHGFVSPSAVTSHLEHVHVLVAPFLPTRHMRYVAHTKLADYGRFALPVIAPAMEGVACEVRTDRFLFDACDYPESIASLVDVLQKVKDPKEMALASEEIASSLMQEPDRFNWSMRCERLRRALYY